MSKINAGQAPSTLIPEYIGSDFDAVLTCADNINDIKPVSENINDVVTVANNILDVNKVITNVDDVALVADNIDYVKNVAEGIEGLPVSGYIGDTPPTQPKVGATWYCTLDGRNYTWYEDVDSGQWVESSPQSDVSVSLDKMTLNAAATDAATTTELVNQIRAGLIAIGLAQ